MKEDNIDEFYTSKSTEALYEGLYYSRPGAVLGVQTNNNWSTTFTNTLNFNKTINKNHTIDAVVGVSWIGVVMMQNHKLIEVFQTMIF
ncbi:hypothetical protein [Zunongwangia endophytica]|uniref:hypothetical protein n=1 Tax=Zunongwangia endophytica TaxID=1808945 RepID=UPI0025B47BBB|nr:hypothetical protein [Zunongwangia endophytica]MDN3596961.1 hypothetical protein [Zunongwangia endophytica]